ncbi:MAG TPA: CdaR family protein [Vicinamibacteria bacterium]|nr:CdaR family protein [Vicinamibacteria bacterium]
MRSFFTENLALKALSLVLAVLVWFAIAGETASEMGLRVPLELQNMPRDLELTGDAVDAVEVRVRASAGIIHGLNPGDVAAQIDLSGSVEGERIVHLTADSIRVPFGVKVVKVTPAMLTLNFERTLQKVVPVRPRLVGRPASGYEVADVTSEPADVRVAGPKSRVDEVESAFTEPLALDAAKDTVDDELSIGLADPLLRIQGSSKVRVTARIREVHEQRTFSGVVVEARGGAARFRPASVQLVLQGPAAALRRLSPQDVKAYVDVAAPATGARRPVAVEIGPGFTGVSLQEAKPAEVAVETARRKG